MEPNFGHSFKCQMYAKDDGDMVTTWSGLKEG